MKYSIALYLIALSVTAVLVRSFLNNGYKTSSNKKRYQASYASMIDESSSTPLSSKDLTISTIRKLASPMLTALSASMLMSYSAFAADDVIDAAPVKPDLGPVPTDFGLVQNDYYADCQKIVNHMRYVVQLEKGNPLIAELAQKTKDEMTDFVSFYRRFQGISGKQSFSLLYTSINVLAGHYTSYGTKIPVPEKRRKRLLQEFNDIEKNIRKKR